MTVYRSRPLPLGALSIGCLQHSSLFAVVVPSETLLRGDTLSKGTRNRWLTNRKLLLVWVAFGILTPISWLGYQIFGPRPAIRVSYETTRITSPLTDDGYVDYAGHVLATYPHSVESLPELKWPLLEIDATDYFYIHYPKISAKANNELDRDRYTAYFNAYHQRIRSAPINRFSHPTTAIQIAANRDCYEALEAALQKPVIIGRNELQNEDREHTLAFNATEGPDLGMLAARVNLHLGEGQTGEAFRVIDCLRLSVERQLKIPLGNQPYSMSLISRYLLHVARAYVYLLLVQELR